jgi:hypothetical protein
VRFAVGRVVGNSKIADFEISGVEPDGVSVIISESDDESVSSGTIDKDLGTLPALIGGVKLTEGDGVFVFHLIKVGGALFHGVSVGDFFHDLIHGKRFPV